MYVERRHSDNGPLPMVHSFHVFYFSQKKAKNGNLMKIQVKLVAIYWQTKTDCIKEIN